MINQSKTDLESDRGSVPSCCSSGTPIQNVAKNSEDILSTELCSDWEEIFVRLDQQDGVRDGQILRASLLSWLETLSLQDTIKLEMMQGMRRERVTSLVTMVDKDKDGFISKQEFLDLVRRKEEHFEKIEKSRLLQYLRVAAFADHYRWSPPPMFSIGLTLVLIGVFIHQTLKQSF